MDERMFLDVDEKLLLKNLKMGPQYDALEKELDSVPSYVILPTPGLCVKTKTDSGEKVFLNICTSDKVPPPEDISETRLLEILSEETPNFVIPMSLGSGRLETDKGGLPCATYDIVINTSYFQKCEKKKSFWAFTISIIMDGISHKFNKTLNADDYIIFKNKKVMGTLQRHRIQNRDIQKRPEAPKVLIEEIKSPYESICEKKTNSPESTNSAELKHILLRQPKEGPPNRLIGLFEIPFHITSDNIEILLNAERIVINIDKIGLVHDIWFPYTVKPKDAECFLVEKLKVLRLNVPVKNVLNKDKEQ